MISYNKVYENMGVLSSNKSPMKENKKVCPIIDNNVNSIRFSHSKSRTFYRYLCDCITLKNCITKAKIHNQEVLHSEYSSKIDNCSVKRSHYSEKKSTKDVSEIIKTNPMSSSITTGLYIDAENIRKTNIYDEKPAMKIERISNVCEEKSEENTIRKYSNRQNNAVRIIYSSPISSTTDNLKSTDDFVSTTSDSRYKLFNMKDAVISQEDCYEIKKSWQLIIDDNLKYFKSMKESKLLPDTKTAISWFYDTFYQNVYMYDEVNKSNMTNIFKNNLKIQARALIVIIENCLYIADIYKSGEKYEFKIMHKVHDKIGIKYKNYVTIFEILLMTFNHCLREQWTNEMELAWCKLISLLLRDILPHYILRHLRSTIRHFVC